MGKSRETHFLEGQEDTRDTILRRTSEHTNKTEGKSLSRLRFSRMPVKIEPKLTSRERIRNLSSFPFSTVLNTFVRSQRVHCIFYYFSGL